MRLDLLAFYGGPDQIMTVTSGLASILGLVLIFWNKAVTTFFRIVRVFHPEPPSTGTESSKESSTHTP